MATAQVIDVIFRGRNDADAAIRGVEQGLANVDKAGEGIGKTTGSLDSMVAGLERLGPLLLATFGIGTIAAFAQKFVDANVELERFAQAVNSIRGAGQAADELEYLRATADRLGLSVNDSSKAYVNLLAATKGTTLEGDAARKIFENIGGAMAALGKSSADTEGVFVALTQSISKGVVQAEEIRGQISERLPGAFAIYAKSLGVTTAEFSDLLKAGAVGIDTLKGFSEEVAKAFSAPERVDTYTASVNRLGNALQETLQNVGKSAGGLGTSLNDFLARDIRGFGANTEYVITAARSLFDVLRGGSFETFSAQMEIAGRKSRDLYLVLDTGNQSLAETARLARQAGDALVETANQSGAEWDRLLRQTGDQTKATASLADSFKTLGVNPDKVKKDLGVILAAFDDLANNPTVKGGQLLGGLEAVLKNIEDEKYLPRLKDQLQEAWAQGRITSDELAKGMGLVAKEQEGLDKKLGVTTKSAADLAKEATRAKEAAEKMALELEKLASNERIKTMEFRANLNIENVKANAAIIQKTFESIDNTVNSTADVINKAFGILGGGNFIDSSVRNSLFKQVEIENANRERALTLQADLTQAQIKVLEAQAKQLQGGDALIKVDGAGLKPHLEAIMWELFKAIQVKVNRDGLNMLLGVA